MAKPMIKIQSSAATKSQVGGLIAPICVSEAGDRRGKGTRGSGCSHVHHDDHCFADTTQCARDHDADQAVSVLRDDALISARGIFLSRGGQPILEGIDLDIGPGEIVTLIGPNGAGKTTLARVLLGLEKPDKGEIRRRDSLVIGYVPQRFDRDPAVPMTVRRFLSQAWRSPDDPIKGALAEVGAGRVIDYQLHQLSGGELQRVILARALIRNPDLLVLDEPVRGVDYVGEAELYKLIGQLRTSRGLGVLLVSHDLHVVMAQSDRVLCLNRHVCCQGVPETVAQHPEYVRLFGAAAVRALAIYTHDHDHAHELGGSLRPTKGE